MGVITQLHCKDGWATSTQDVVPLSEYLDELPPAKGGEAGAHSAVGSREPSGGAKLISEEPWMLHHIDLGTGMPRSREGGRRPAEEGGGVDEVMEDSGELPFWEECDPEAIVVDVYAEMEIARASCIVQGLHEKFRTRPLGGEDLMEREGKSWDAYRGEAVGAKAISFCKRYINTDGKRFNRSVYTDEGAAICAYYWAYKLSHYFSIWCAEGEPVPFTFNIGHHDAFVEPPRFTELCLTLVGDYPQQVFRELRNLRPHGNGML